MQHPSRHHARAGLSMLEVVFAMALLGVVAAATMSALSYVLGRQAREQKTLAAAELANRLIVMYLDDPNSALEQEQILEWINGDRYRWKIDKARLTMTPAVPPPADVRPSATADAIHLIKVRVWLDEASGGTLEYSPSIAAFSTSRIINPLANLTRPDTAERLLREYGAGAIGEYMRTGQLPPRISGGGGGSR